MNDELYPFQSPRYWDEQAVSFDDEPDHGLRNPAVRRAWTEQLMKWLPPGRASILDVGCGTGSLSLVLAELGHQVTGIDWSPAMIGRAKAKAAAAGLEADFKVGDAADPQLSPRRFDAILSRHVLWALPEPAEALRRWAELLVAGGRLVVIEGYWHTGGGLHAQDTLRMFSPRITHVQIYELSDEPLLWGSAVTDERYAIVAVTSPES